MKQRLRLSHLLAIGCGFLLGCNNSTTTNSSGKSTGGASAGTPVFTLAWSEYPSWSVFGVADKEGLLDGNEGAMGTLEKKWNVDIVLNLAEYDPCITQYGANAADAVCITNMDILAPSLKRASVAILPTSTSVGADACIAVGIDNVDGLKGKETFGLEKSVSQYVFERVLELQGKNPGDFPFKNQDPGVAATAMQASQAGTEAIMVWNPFAMQTLRLRKDSKVLFDSSSIPEEIIDMVVVGKDSLNKPGGDRFAYAIVETFYAVNQRMADPKTQDSTLVSLGEKFSKLGLEDMKEIVQQTRFYATPQDGLALLQGENFRTQTMPLVADFCVSHDMCDSKPSFGFDDDSKQLNITTKFITGFNATPTETP
jgi:ABC-type nitrate/sulfonate/bicarbonate transport system substrate-binding protein